MADETDNKPQAGPTDSEMLDALAEMITRGQVLLSPDPLGVALCIIRTQELFIGPTLRDAIREAMTK